MSKKPFYYFLFLLLSTGLTAAELPGNGHEALLQSSVSTIENSLELTNLMTQLAGDAIETHCAACHGSGLDGKVGVPSLVDWEWLWGINGDEVSTTEPVMKIMQTILYGIRDRDCSDEVKQYGACPDTRYSEMPAYTQLGFSAQQLSDLTEAVLHLADKEADMQAVGRAEESLAYCTECHGEGLAGYRNYGGPDLTDDIWLYGESREAVYESIADGRLGYCPPYWETLDAVTIKALGVYIYLASRGY